MTRPLALFFAIHLLMLPLSAQALETAEEIVACMEGSQPDGSSIQTIAMRSKDRIGAVIEMNANLFWQKGDDGFSKIHIEFDAPADLRGSKLLMLEQEGRNDTFMYLPELGKTRRVTSDMMSGSVFGTDFSYEEFQFLQGIEQIESTERSEDIEVIGRPAYVLILSPSPEEDSEYTKIRIAVDRETCIPLQIEFIDKAGRVRKVLATDWSTVTREGELWVPRRMTLADQIEGTSTEIEIQEIEIGADIPRAMFSQSSLEKR